MIFSKPATPIFINLNNRSTPYRRHQQLDTSRQLLLASRAMNAEVGQFVYATSHVFIRFSDQGDLAALRRLRPASVRAMRILTIHLNVTSCGLGQQGYHAINAWQKHEYEQYNPKHDTPLYLSEDGTQVWRA